MLSIPYYHSLLKKYVVIFGTLFNNIRIERLNADGSVEQTLKVPIAYGPREKFLARTEANPDANAITAIRLPRMGFEITNIAYAPSRKLQTTTKVYTETNVEGTNTIKKAYVPVPYDITFTLSIMSKSTEDGTRILEQILPYFTPEWTVSAKLLADFNNYTDIPIVIGNLSIEDTYDSNFLQRRALIYTINFTMKTYLYGPVTESKLIKIADININNPIDSPTNTLQTIEVQPGLDSSGNPTTLLANTIPYSQIDNSDNFGYITTITESPNGY
jgi:hypothetical protein